MEAEETTGRRKEKKRKRLRDRKKKEKKEVEEEACQIAKGVSLDLHKKKAETQHKSIFIHREM